MSRWLADLCIPVLAVTRFGFMLGFVGRDSTGKRYAHTERLFMRPKHRGVVNTLLKFQVHDKWVAACRRRGITLTVTRVRTDRPKLIDMIERFGGYRVHHADKLLTYLHLNLANPTAMKNYAEQRQLAAARFSEES